MSFCPNLGLHNVIFLLFTISNYKDENIKIDNDILSPAINIYKGCPPVFKFSLLWYLLDYEHPYGGNRNRFKSFVVPNHIYIFTLDRYIVLCNDRHNWTYLETFAVSTSHFIIYVLF